MKYIVELNPAMHLEYFTIEAESPEAAGDQAKLDAQNSKCAMDLAISYWEVINVYPDENTSSA